MFHKTTRHVNDRLKDAQKGQNLRSFSSALQGEKNMLF